MRLDTPSGGQIMFSKGVPIASQVGGAVYFHCNPGAEQKAVNGWSLNAPHVRCSAEQFDFIVGQVLTLAGLPLTRTE